MYSVKGFQAGRVANQELGTRGFKRQALALTRIAAVKFLTRTQNRPTSPTIGHMSFCWYNRHLVSREKRNHRLLPRRNLAAKPALAEGT